MLYLVRHVCISSWREDTAVKMRSRMACRIGKDTATTDESLVQTKSLLLARKDRDDDSMDDEIYLEASQKYEESLLATNEDPTDDSMDDKLYLEASQKYEESVRLDSDTNNDLYPISPATEVKYDEMDEDDFGIDRLMEGTGSVSSVSEGVQSSSMSGRQFAKPVSEHDILSKIKRLFLHLHERQRCGQ